MAPIKWRYSRARRRLEQKQMELTSAERFLIAMFLTEKIVRRTLVQLAVWQGMTVEDAFESLKRTGLGGLKMKWKKYDKHSRSLDSVIGSVNWTVLEESARCRNELVHGSGHLSQGFYGQQLGKLLPVHDAIKWRFRQEYRYSGWKHMTDANGNRI